MPAPVHPLFCQRIVIRRDNVILVDNSRGMQTTGLGAGCLFRGEITEPYLKKSCFVTEIIGIQPSTLQSLD